MNLGQQVSSIIVIIGIVLIIISQTVPFTKPLVENLTGRHQEIYLLPWAVEDTQTKNMFLYSGIGVAIVGLIAFILNSRKSKEKSKAELR